MPLERLPCKGIGSVAGRVRHDRGPQRGHKSGRCGNVGKFAHRNPRQKGCALCAEFPPIEKVHRLAGDVGDHLGPHGAARPPPTSEPNALNKNRASPILAGTQPPDLSLERIVRSGIPLDWAEQEAKFGFR